MVRGSGNELARIHGLWTLEGLGLLTPEIVRERLKDDQPQVRIAAIRTSETLFKNGDTNLVADIASMASDADPNVVIQAMLTVKILDWNESATFIDKTMPVTLQRV